MFMCIYSSTSPTLLLYYLFSQEKYYIQVPEDHIHTSKLQNFITYQSLQLFLVSCVSIFQMVNFFFSFLATFQKVLITTESFLLFISSFSPIKKLTTFNRSTTWLFSLSLSLSWSPLSSVFKWRKNQVQSQIKLWENGIWCWKFNQGSFEELRCSCWVMF